MSLDCSNNKITELVLGKAEEKYDSLNYPGNPLAKTTVATNAQLQAAQAA